VNKVFGPFYDFMEGYRGRFPPVVSCHSYSGTAEFAGRLVGMEGGKGTRFYFGFSRCVNFGGGGGGGGEGGRPRSRERLEGTMRGIPVDRILVESDVMGGGCNVEECLGTLGCVVEVLEKGGEKGERVVASGKGGKGREKIVRQICENGWEFLRRATPRGRDGL